MWKILCDELYLTTVTFKTEIHAFVMMPNHFHLLITTPEDDLGKIMGCFLSYATRTANLKSGRSGRVFGGPYHWSIIDSGFYYLHALKYVYRNPVKAQIVEQVQDYPFSTMPGLLGETHLPLPIHHPRSGHGISLFPKGNEELLSWLNRAVPPKIEQSIQRGLRHRRFEIPLDRMTRKRPAWVETLI